MRSGRSACHCKASGRKDFNPRTPRGVRPIPHDAGLGSREFQSTHPAGGATHASSAALARRCHFNPRTPRGVRRVDLHKRRNRLYFNPRTPRGVRRAMCGRPLPRVIFQSTHPAGGATRAGARNGHCREYFNPRTPRGVRQQNGPFLGPFCRYKTKKITYFPENEETLHSNRKKMLLFDTFSRANLPGDPCSLALRSLHKKRIRWQIGRFAPKMLHFVFISIPQIIEPQAVLLFVHNRYQFCLKNTALRRIERAFKDGVLHSLPVVYTLLCDLPEALAPFCILGVDVISDQYEHMASLPQKRRIPIEVAAQMSGKQHSLRIWNHSP